MTDAEQRTVADIVLAQLKPILTDILHRLPEPGELAAIDKGIGAALHQLAEMGCRVEKIDGTLRNFADNQLSLTEEVRGYHNNRIDQYDRLGKRVHDLEEWRKRIENGETTLAETGRQ